MQIPIGEMRESVVLLTPVLSRDESGGEVKTYTESPPFYVAIRALNARETLSYGQINADISHVCFGHYFDLVTIGSNALLRVKETGQEFDVIGPAVNSPDRDWSKLTLVWREHG